MFTRRRIQYIGKFLLLLLVGMQASFAANAGFQFAPQSQPAESQVAMPSCHNGANADLSRSLCRLHCVTDGQSVTQFDSTFVLPCLKGAPVLALQPAIVKRRVPILSWRNALSHDPPIPIRFCSLLI
jgi:hypothetical protein